MKKIAVFISAVVIGASLCGFVNAQTTDATTPTPAAATTQEKTAPAVQPTQQNSDIQPVDNTQQQTSNSSTTPVSDKEKTAPPKMDAPSPDNTKTSAPAMTVQPSQTAAPQQEDLGDWVEIGRDSFFNLRNFEYSDDGLIGYWVKLGKGNALKAVERTTTGHEDYFLVSNCKNNTITYLDKVLYDEQGNVIGDRKSGSDFPNVAKNPAQYAFEAVNPDSTEQYIQRNACLVYDYVKAKGNTFNRADLAKLFSPTKTAEVTTTSKTVLVSDVYPISENPNWHKISENKYFDLTSVKTSDKGVSTVWVKEYNDGSFELIDTKKILYNMSLVQYDCANKKTKILRSIDYDLNQKVIRDFDYSNFAIWKVSQDKNSDLEYAFLCTYKKDMK